MPRSPSPTIRRLGLAGVLGALLFVPGQRAQAQFIRDPLGTIKRCVKMGPAGCAQKTAETGGLPGAVIIGANAGMIGQAEAIRNVLQTGQFEVQPWVANNVAGQVRAYLGAARGAGVYPTPQHCYAAAAAYANTAYAVVMAKTGGNHPIAVNFSAPIYHGGIAGCNAGY